MQKSSSFFFALGVPGFTVLAALAAVGVSACFPLTFFVSTFGRWRWLARKETRTSRPEISLTPVRTPEETDSKSVGDREPFVDCGQLTDWWRTELAAATKK